MKQTVKKLALVASIAATLGGGVSVASAAVQYPEGGVWTYGSGNGGAGGTSRAWIRTSWGEKVAFYYNV